MLLDEELAAMDARAAAATPGPWDDTSDWPRVFAPGSKQVAQCCTRLTAKTRTGWTADTKFIAHARQDVPRLVAEVRALKAARKVREDEWCEAIEAVRLAIRQNHPGVRADGYFGELLAEAARLLAVSQRKEGQDD